MPYKILIIDDEILITELLSSHLQDCGYETIVVNSGKDALNFVSQQPDLILLDIMMPDIDGLELCRRIRDHISCPILFLTARITEQDKVNGFQYGGDDYITKPFSLKELTARVEAHLRREKRQMNRDSILTSNELIINLSQRRVYYQEKEILLSKTEFDLLVFFVTNANNVFDREHIYTSVWGYNADGNSSVIKEHVHKLRVKLRDATGQDFIETVWGVGYRWNK